jgi:site-specific recombinase XerD
MKRKSSRKIEALEALAARPGTEFEGALARAMLAKELEKPREKKERAESRRDNDGLHRRRGVWYYTLNINGRRRFFSTKTENYQEARTKRSDAIQAQKENRLPNDLAKLPFETLLTQVLEARRPHLADGTVRIERERSRPLLKFFTGQRVSKIADAPTIRRYQAYRAEQGTGPRTINLEVKLLRVVLKAAKVWASIADDVKHLKEDRRGPGRAIDESQERMLFDAARTKTQWAAAFYAAMVAANTTCRGVELKNLTLADVNLIDSEIVVRRSKTDAGLRRIPLNAGAQWAFARLLERANALGAVKPEHYIFPHAKYREKTAGPRGTGYDPKRPQKTWRTAWRALVKATAREAGREAAREALEAGRGLRPAITAFKRAAAALAGLRFHDLRHLAITKLAESDASDATIMAISGHMDRAMMEHYSHVRAAAKRNAVDSMRSYVPKEKKPVVTTETLQ